MRYCYQGWFRFGLAIFVLWSHTAVNFFPEYGDLISSFQLGNFAVAGFFILSGYLMFGAISQVYEKCPERFILNRYLRIGPPLFVAALISIFFHGFLVVDIPFGAFSRDNLIYAFSSSIFPFNVVITKFFSVKSIDYDFVRYIWAIFTELIFYWCVFLYGIAVKFSKNIFHMKMNIISFIFFFSISLLGIFVNYIPSFKFIELVLPFSFHIQWGGHFLLGISLFLYLRVGRSSKVVFSVFASASLAIVQFYLYTNKSLEGGGYVPIIGYIVCLLWIFAIVNSERGFVLFGRGIPRELDKSLGDISYPLYINHFALSLGLTPLFQMIFLEEGLVHRSVYYLGFTVLLCVLSLGIIRVTDWITDGLRDRVRGIRFS
ncbi:MAG: acyltransferase family protein [Rhodospirillales bacterium]|nr:acyltransferase family protein [Rhodospirillales bacterium]